MPTKLADRVTELERQMAELKEEVRASRSSAPATTPPKDAWRATFGAFKDDPFYDDMVRIGRNWRRRQRKC